MIMVGQCVFSKQKQVDQIEFEINEISNYNHVMRWSFSVVEVFGVQ